MISEPESPSDGRALSNGRALTWAVEQLGVPPESSPEVCTAGFLRRLADEDFVPPPRLRQAWEFAARRSSEAQPALPWIDSAAEGELRGSIEEFAIQFFNLPPEQRTAHWERLYADARPWPRLETRLRRLKPGLTIEFTPQPALFLREAQLIQWIRELFTLPPDERAVRRRQVLREHVRSDMRPWQKAARRVRRRQRAIAALAPDLLRPLATWSRLVSAASKNRPLRKVTIVRSRPTIRSVWDRFKSRGLWIVAWPVFLVILQLINLGQQPRPRPNVEPHRVEPSDSVEFNKGVEEALKVLRKNGQFPNRDPGSPFQSPFDPLPPGERQSPATLPGNDGRGILTPLFNQSSPTAPVAPPGSAR